MLKVSLSLLLFFASTVHAFDESRLEIDSDYLSKMHELHSSTVNGTPPVKVTIGKNETVIDCSAIYRILEVRPAMQVFLGFDSYQNWQVEGYKDATIIQGAGDWGNTITFGSDGMVDHYQNNASLFTWVHSTLTINLYGKKYVKDSKDFLEMRTKTGLDKYHSDGVIWEKTINQDWPQEEASGFTQVEGSVYLARMPWGQVYVRYYQHAKTTGNIPGLAKNAIRDSVIKTTQAMITNLSKRAIEQASKTDY